LFKWRGIPPPRYPPCFERTSRSPVSSRASSFWNIERGLRSEEQTSQPASSKRTGLGLPSGMVGAGITNGKLPARLQLQSGRLMRTSGAPLSSFTGICDPDKLDQHPPKGHGTLNWWAVALTKLLAYAPTPKRGCTVAPERLPSAAWEGAIAFCWAFAQHSGLLF
jgi:hypothetical protein